MDRPCKRYNGAHNKKGRPVHDGGKLVSRSMYQLWNQGEDITTLEVHHLCGNGWCIEPTHLEAVGRNDHMRGHTERRRADQTHCANGHEWTEETTRYQTQDGYQCRYCRVCANEKAARYRERKRTHTIT